MGSKDQEKLHKMHVKKNSAKVSAYRQSVLYNGYSRIRLLGNSSVEYVKTFDFKNLSVNRYLSNIYHMVNIIKDSDIILFSKDKNMHYSNVMKNLTILFLLYHNCHQWKYHLLLILFFQKSKNSIE